MHMTTTPKVAIITRTKDRGILLERAIKSIHQQTMDDFIHVIINDAGDKRVVDDLVKKYKTLIKDRVKVIHNTESRGMEAASNKAIKSVDSTYVAIHDDDDSWHPDFLKRTTEHLDSTGAMGVVVATDRIDEEIDEDAGEVRELSRTRWMPDMHAISLYAQCLDNQMTPITFIYRRDAYSEIGYYDESLLVCGDWDFGIRFAREWDVDFIEEYGALAYYHHRPYVPGKQGNSVFGGTNLHEIYLNKLLNKYLREDIKKGMFGVGYIMCEMRNSRILNHRIRDQIDERTVRVEGHMNHVVDDIKRYTLRHVAQKIKNRINNT